ncbi:TolC family protein [Acidiphilium sp. AL]|uniref:TolC family protein n=1 Tax=Acidiphilium sp. AL TaxID=2871704 RepID=UPI0021CB3249|nr:TolC family protein [Acidiphilium sp. AL]MCU4160292.1 TolC family protein [Acidiphilium sp. AL]
MRRRFCHRGGMLLAALALAGCATYRAKPLANRPNLVSSVASLHRTIPAMTAKDPPVTLAPTQSFSIDQIGLLAILNDPDLAEQRGQLGLAKAALLSASILPNPSLGLGFAALISGPGSTPSYAASLSQDITSLITYRARVAAARASLGSVNASLLWQEWQVAQQARLLALDIHGDNAEIRYLKRELSLLSTELAQVSQATALGNLDLTAEAPLIAANAGAETALASARLTRLKVWQQLDALLGLEPSVRFAISRPELTPPPADLTKLLTTLPERRPDLVALRLGYRTSEEQLRAAILAQFPPLALGPSGGTDTSNVLSVGPTLTMELPIFNRNQGGIASAKATREVLHAQYQAALDHADGMVHGLSTRIAVLAADLVQARDAAATARRLSRNAENAYAQGNLDQRALVDYQTTALKRELDVIAYQTRLDTDQLALGIELGVGLPRTRLVNHTGVTHS